LLSLPFLKLPFFLFDLMALTYSAYPLKGFRSASWSHLHNIQIR
jgi:hypothetical protein